MAAVVRLALRWFVASLLLVSRCVWAVPADGIPAGVGANYSIGINGVATVFGSGDAACQAYKNTTSYWQWTVVFHEADRSCFATSPSGDSSGTISLVSVAEGPKCDDPKTFMSPDPAGGSYCACYSGHTANGACRETTDADCPAAGTDLGGEDNVFGRMPGGGSCVGGCKINGSQSICAAGSCFTTGPYQSSGKACSSADRTPKQSGTSADCAKQGLGSGTVNGVVVCVPATSTSTTKTSSTTSTSASGVASGSTTTTETTDNHDGSTTTTTTTTRSDGSTRSTTTTGPTPSPAASGSGGSDQPPSDMCKLHPDLAVCKVSTFSGACSSSFACDGDAVQCAIAKEQHQRNCAFFEPTGPAVDAYTNARSDGDSPAWSPTNVANVDATTIDFASGIRTDKHFGSSCVEDQVVVLTHLGRAVVIPWSSWCSQMQLIGKLVLAVSALLCVGIVFKQ